MDKTTPRQVSDSSAHSAVSSTRPPTQEGPTNGDVKERSTHAGRRARRGFSEIEVKVGEKRGAWIEPPWRATSGSRPRFAEQIELAHFQIHGLPTFLLAALLDLEAHRARVLAVERHRDGLSERILLRVFHDHARPSECLQRRPMPAPCHQHSGETDQGIETIQLLHRGRLRTLVYHTRQAETSMTQTIRRRMQIPRASTSTVPGLAGQPPPPTGTFQEAKPRSSQVGIRTSNSTRSPRASRGQVRAGRSPSAGLEGRRFRFSVFGHSGLLWISGIAFRISAAPPPRPAWDAYKHVMSATASCHGAGCRIINNNTKKGP